MFLLNGGYIAIEQKELREENRKQVEWSWRRGYEAITLIVAVIAIGFTAATYIFTPKESDIKKLQGQIDSLKHLQPSLVKLPPAAEQSAVKQPILQSPISSTSRKNRILIR